MMTTDLGAGARLTRGAAFACLSALLMAASSLPAAAVVVAPQPLSIAPGTVSLSASMGAGQTDCIDAGVATPQPGCSSQPLTPGPYSASVTNAYGTVTAQATISDNPGLSIHDELNLGAAEGIADATATYSVGVLGPAGQSATLTITGYVTASDIQASGPIIAGSVGYSFVGPSDDPGSNPGMTELINSSVLEKSALLPGTLSVVAGQVYTLLRGLSGDRRGGG
jgi:hypothetical protein